jgi:hypothetical protein
MANLTVKCQNCRDRVITDANGSTQFKRNARCSRMLGRMADIDGAKMGAAIGGVLRGARDGKLSDQAAVRMIMNMFCQSFVAGYFCPACRAFMDVRFTNPGFAVSSEPLSLSPRNKVMAPRIQSTQVEVG